MTRSATLAGIACTALMAVALCAAPASADSGFQHGFVLTGWKADSYLTQGASGGLQRMADDGSDHVAVFTQWFMDSPTSSLLEPDPARTPTDAGILHAIEVARTAGMAVTLKPQIGIRSGNWIGYAHPADLEAFWANYRLMLLHYADLAQQGGATMLVIGTEMATLSSDEAHWRPLIAEVRAHFSGQLTYAANYDEFQRVPFWDALDYIGVDAYFGLADSGDPAPPVEALAAAWTARGYVDAIAAVSERTHRRVLFTEIGYRGTHATAVHPNIWNGTQITDTQAQANAYEAFYRAVAGQPWMAGLYWWEVNADSWWVQDYNPIGKQAEQVMVDWNKRVATPPALVEPPPVIETPPVVVPPVVVPPVIEPPPVVVPPTVEPPPVEPPPVVEPPAVQPPAVQAPIVEPPPTNPAPPPAPDAVSPPAPAPSPAPAANPAPTTEVAPAPAPAPSAATLPPPAPRATIRLSFRGRRLVGTVTPYSPRCRGHVVLRLRVQRAGRWRYLRSPAPLALTATGGFERHMASGRLRIKALYAAGCEPAASSWVTTVP